MYSRVKYASVHLALSWTETFQYVQRIRSSDPQSVQ